MKLKPIEPRTAIHCTEEIHIVYLAENELVMHHMLEKSVPIWIAFDGCFPSNRWMPEISNTSHSTGKDYYESIGYKCVEFSDLIISELSAEEVLESIEEICDRSSCFNCPLNDESGCICRDNNFNPKKIIKACEQWKADHEKKKTEVEWVYKGVADTASATEIEYFDTEDDAREWCERRTIETGLNHAYCPVCRIKAV